MTAPADRFPAIARERLSEAQRAVEQRGEIKGPFAPALHSAGLCGAMIQFREYLRAVKSLPDAPKELAALITGRFWNAAYHWHGHSRRALEAGVAPHVVEAIGRDERPAGMPADLEEVYEFCRELHHEHAVSDRVFEKIQQRFGCDGAMDLIGVCGHYTVVCMVLNVAQIGAPGAPPLRSEPS